MIQTLFEELGQGEFLYDVKHDHEGNLSHLFISHPKSITLTKNYSSVFVMDCTYKTNKYKMPLLNIVGVTSFNTTFFSAVIFLQKEEVGDYVWALECFVKILGLQRQPLTIVTDRELALLNAIKVVFPDCSHLLCAWHIEKNIMAKCKKNFKTKEEWEEFILDWTNVMKSPGEMSFCSSWGQLREKYSHQALVIAYIENNWLPFKEKFFYAWTNKVMHFGNHVTSRVGGAHSKLKRYLQVSTGDLRGVKDKLCLLIDNEFQEIKAQLSDEKIRVPHKFQIPLFKEIVGHVSVYALGELLKQYELSKSDALLTCKGNFTSSMGLPCAHDIKGRLLPIQLADIHPQWRLDIRSLMSSDGERDQIEGLLKKVYDNYHKLPLTEKNVIHDQLSRIVDLSVPLANEPRTCLHKGRPLGSVKRRNESSTTRDPSLFEIMEKTQNRHRKI
ncbi:protein FAR1-RELATED SEQUENCE 4-like [Daucus carota subsp. sativus]|uniref:protein FAR1-RELATED SEQUENCE 4-like n=1 Tax=Daucus carota subsp. sativus TaxID=79200 RepID=UPI00308299C2